MRMRTPVAFFVLLLMWQTSRAEKSPKPFSSHSASGTLVGAAPRAPALKKANLVSLLARISLCRRPRGKRIAAAGGGLEIHRDVLRCAGPDLGRLEGDEVF